MQYQHGGVLLVFLKKNRLGSVVRKAKKYGFLPPSYDNLEDLSLISDEKLFFSVQYRPNHVLKQLLPPPKTPKYSLRDRLHNFTLSSDISNNKMTLKEKFHLQNVIYGYILDWFL